MDKRRDTRNHRQIQAKDKRNVIGAFRGNNRGVIPIMGFMGKKVGFMGKKKNHLNPLKCGNYSLYLNINKIAMEYIKINDYEFRIVRTYTNKMVIEIAPCGVTPPNADDYPMYVYCDIDDRLEDVAKDLASK